ncbi:GvpL/GvpF family gas vesicle protein [Streptomyces sp. TRM66268-LWL]|uniref:GvpL/GvpF family gas vesicle protein n=1 Tax=Streptomyces polyasparticus TaxID=2767826 RepID=A0ABR7SF56_9ACTN|nr:GvpL/GvpF family gas vesicle protein [Streptomyces polyasparticus]MBC9713380.1 GvpL/GvpF family gas vesicle protein [Streptomyces polyasparticus]
MNDLRYVYAVCRPFEAALQSDLVGVGGAPLKQLAHGGLVAVLSQVPEADFGYEPLRAHLEDLDWLTGTARAHQAVIAALTTVTCPVPLRLGTVFRDDSGVRTMLQDEGEQLRELLSRIDGCVEWGVKVYAEPTSEPEQAEVPQHGPSASGRDYLRMRRARQQGADRMWARAESFADKLHRDLTARAAATRLHRPQNPELSRVSGRNILNGAYLVGRSASEEFVECVERTKDQEPELRVELTGPWAAYSFSSPDSENGEEVW